MATAINLINLSDDEPQSSIPHPYMHQHSKFPLKFRFHNKHQIAIRDDQGLEITHSYRIRNPRSFLCSIDAILLANSTSELRKRLYNFINLCNIPDLNRQSRLYLAQIVVDALKSVPIFPLRQMRADVEIVKLEHSWIPIPIRHNRQSMVDEGVWIMDAGDLVGGESRTGASESDLSKLMEKGRFEYRSSSGDGEGEEECSICWEKYVEGMKAIEMGCSHVFHEKCILRWLKTKNSCPLCRQTV